MQTLAEMLRASIWARELTAPQLERVLADTRQRAVVAGGYVAHKGERVDAWLGVVDGLVKMSSVSPAGKLVTFTGVTTGGWFGEGSLLKDRQRKYDIVALRDSRIAVMPRVTFLWLLDSSIPFNRFLLTQLNERLGQFIALVEYDRMLEPDARVARCIAALFNPHLYPGTRHRLQISQEEIGHLSATSRQRCNQALQLMEKARLIRLEYGGIVVLDLEGLRNYGA
jgi:CRP-like cAMP-binding protein